VSRSADRLSFVCNHRLLTDNTSSLAVTNNRILLRKTIPSTRDSALFRWAISDHALLNGVLVLSASSLIKCRQELRAAVEPTLYQHKTEAIRIVNERLGDRIVATSDGTMGAITCLAILEVGVFGLSNPSRKYGQ